MPVRNVLKHDIPFAYYHVYARGADKQSVFLDHADFTYFLSLFERYLSVDPLRDSSSREYPHLRGKADLLAYCLMGNHFHLFLFQIEEKAMSTLMRGVMTSYSRYFNTRYNRSGPLFESRYKASMIVTPSYFEHISRYIHLNPKDWRTYPYSSIHAYIGGDQPEWLQPKRILEMFSDPSSYEAFMTDYEGYKSNLDEIKGELADTVQ